jgi:hypothetical protein
MDLIHRIQIQRSGSKLARLTGIGGLTGGLKTRSGPLTRHPAAQILHRRDHGGVLAASGGATTASGGATTFRSWGALIVAGFSPGHPDERGEHHGGPQGRRGRLDAADGEKVRRRRSVEDGTVTRCTRIQTSSPGGLLTLRRSFGAAPSNLEGGDGAVSTRRRDTGRRRCGGPRVWASAAAGARVWAREAARWRRLRLK